jgi:MYXO-CTERM domain-containing protein
MIEPVRSSSKQRLILAVLALCLLLAPLAASREAAANGRPPGTSTINFRPGMEQHVTAGMTFGMVLTRDGGATWTWMCEEALGYGGMYDPDFVFTADDAIFATTFNGLKRTEDACTFGSALGSTFVSTVAQGPNNRVYYGASDSGSPTAPADSKIYRSDDGGMTFPMSSAPGIARDWWQSLEVAPSDPDRVYLAGYRNVPDGMGGNVKVLLLFRSNDGAQSWQQLATSQIATMPNSILEVAGISHTDPNLVFLRVKLEDNTLSDAIYRSTDGGASWTRVLGKPTSLSFVVRRSGELVAATQSQGAVRSTNNGASWIDLPSPPHINCLAENSAGEVWACTQNYGGMQAPSDGYGIMKSTDLVTWQPVLKYQEIQAPIPCADGTTQRDRCDRELWCGLCSQLGCESGRPECRPPGDRTDATEEPGCCDNRATPAPGVLVLVLGLGVLLRRRRRR